MRTASLTSPGSVQCLHGREPCAVIAMVVKIAEYWWVVSAAMCVLLLLLLCRERREADKRAKAALQPDVMGSHTLAAM